MKQSKINLWPFLFLIFFWLNNCLAAQQVDVTNPGALFPIAIPKFKNLDGKPDPYNISGQMAEIISNDLAFTGLFRILDSGSFLEDSQKSGITADDIDFQSWMVIGAQGLVKGGFSQKGGEIIIEARLF
ncbi:MAG: hypothetical protein N3A64_01880, partial [Desulfobacterota bacterium]|nr:hypothetical protein [Thermodesulfobacteriota bacterium]